MPSTVVVHEWIAAHGGSENVAEAMADVLDADVYCLWREDPSRFSSRSVRESPLARSPFLSRHKALSLPLMPWVWRHTDLSAYERIVVSSHVRPSGRLGARVSPTLTSSSTCTRPPATSGLPTSTTAVAIPWSKAGRHRCVGWIGPRPRHASFAVNSEFVRAGWMTRGGSTAR